MSSPFNTASLPKIGMFDLNKPMPDMTPFTYAAQYFKKHGQYPHYNYKNKKNLDLNQDSPFRKFWNEERRRCREGMWVRNDYISGDLYHHFNYAAMWIIPELTEEEQGIINKGGAVSKDRAFSPPDPWDSTYHMDNYFAEARAQGKHGGVIKSRGLGVSYYFASCGTNTYFHWQGEKVLVIGPSEASLLASDAILTRIWEQMDFEDKYTPFYKIREGGRSNTQLVRKAKQVTRGRNQNSEATSSSHSSSIEGRLSVDPQKLRGNRAKRIIVDEAGINKNLVDIIGVMRRGVEQNAVVYGQIMFGGTGGSKLADLVGLTTVVKNPDAYNVLGVPNVFSKVSTHKPMALFLGAYWNNQGFMKNGISDIQAAYNHEIGKRKKQETAADATDISFTQYVAENAMHPEEALMSVGRSKMPIDLLQARLDVIGTMKKNKTLTVKHGRMDYTDLAKPKFIPNVGVPLNDFPITNTKDLTSAVCILDEPVAGKTYFAAFDPYSNDKANTKSAGAFYVMDELKDKLVSWYVGRPNTATDIAKIAIATQVMYNKAGMLVENVTGGPIGYYRLLGYSSLLLPKPSIVSKMLPGSRAQTNVGMHKVEKIYQDTLNWIADWLVRPAVEDPNITNLDQIEDAGLIKELILIAENINFDRMSALSLLFLERQERLVKRAIAARRPVGKTNIQDEIEKHINNFEDENQRSH